VSVGHYRGLRWLVGEKEHCRLVFYLTDGDRYGQRGT
jgi:hypothetical protein